ncbi:RNA 2',3'-cyclic phosphodiesterase [Aneurinibacillus sp. BA2021]|nr:RNA 2',3'-cyclic phosphodiesterase [Aneurinibacillus sp. BA2021]
MMRLFTAIQIQEDAVQELLQLQLAVKQQFVSRKWQPADRMHLTLHFLGELSEQQADTVKQELSRAAAACQPFELCLAGIGAFPSLHKPRVLWAGIKNEDGRLSDFQQALADRLRQEGLYNEDRRYSPHVTIAREVSLKEAESGQSSLPAVQPIRWMVHEVTLFRSTLTGKGPLYEVVDTYPFHPSR